MNPSSIDSPGPKLEVRGPGASAVIVQRVSADKEERFMALQRGIVQAAQGFAGYQKVDVYPPSKREHTEWVVVIHFDGPEAMQRWLDSSVRAEWIAKFHSEIGESHLQKLPSGFGAWFTGQINDTGEALPPSWKMALTVLLGLYPTVMLLHLFVGQPYLSPLLGIALAMLISNALSSSILQWGVMPVLNRLLGPWLLAHGQKGKVLTVVGLLLILVVLGVLALLFRLVTG